MLNTYPTQEYIIPGSHSLPISKKAMIHPGHMNTLFGEYWPCTNLIKFMYYSNIGNKRNSKLLSYKN